MANNKYAYIVDSSICFTEKLAENKNVYKVCFDITDSLGNSYEDDSKNISPEKIMNDIENGIIFKSNAVSPGKVMILLEDLIEQYDKIILFTISSGLSSFNQNIQYLIDEYKSKFYVVDTGEIGLGITSIVLNTIDLLENKNENLDKVLEMASHQHEKHYTMFTCKNWEPLRKSGRAPSLIAKTFDLIKVKPLIKFDLKNKLDGITVTFKKQVSKMIDGFFNHFKNISIDRISKIVFYNNELKTKDADYVREEIVKAFNVEKKDIIETYVPNLVLIYTSKESFGIHIQIK